MGQSPTSAVRNDRSDVLRRPQIYLPHAKRVGLLPAGRYSALRVLQIRTPRKVLFCVRRKQRREVLFAIRRAGYSGSARKPYYRRTVNSQYRC